MTDVQPVRHSWMVILSGAALLLGLIGCLAAGACAYFMFDEVPREEMVAPESVLGPAYAAGYSALSAVVHWFVGGLLTIAVRVGKRPITRFDRLNFRFYLFFVPFALLVMVGAILLGR